MLNRKDLTQEQIDWLLAHPELNALLDRLITGYQAEAEAAFKKER